MIEYLDLSKKNYRTTEHMTNVIRCGGGFDSNSLYLGKGDSLTINLKTPSVNRFNLIFEFAGDNKSKINLKLNGNSVAWKYSLKTNDVFNSYYYALSASYMKKGDNKLFLELYDGAKLNVTGVELYDKSAVTVNKSWMSRLPDNKCIGDVNLPGTHDTAAVNEYMPTFSACHNSSVKTQLEGGVRLLDVRLKVKRSWQFGFYFMTCHGDLAGNEYEPLDSLFTTVKNFLKENNKETVVISLRIDDWNGFQKRSDEVLHALDVFLLEYPVYRGDDKLPTLDKLRGKIYLMNRINGERRFGQPLGWNDNTTGEEVNSDFKYYVQDKYSGLSYRKEDEKAQYFWNALKQKPNYKMVLNFASATWFGVTGVYIGHIILNRLGALEAGARQKQIGWALFDYEFTEYVTDDNKHMNIVEFWIDSNFDYANFKKKFSVRKH